MPTDSEIELVRQALPTIPFLRSYKGPIERLGGMRPWGLGTTSA